jgi:hypothetical protein
MSSIAQDARSARSVFVIPIVATTVSLLGRVVLPLSQSNSRGLRGRRIAAALALTPVLLIGAAARLNAQPAVTSFAWVGDGSTGLTGIDVRTLEVVPLPGSTAAGAVAYSPDGTRLYVAEAGAIAVYHPHIGGATRLRSFPVGLTSPTGMAITTDGSTAYVTDTADHEVVVVNLVSETVITTITDPNLVSPEGIVLSPDGAYFYVTTPSQGVVQFSTASNLQTNRAPANGTTLVDIVIEPDGSRVFASAPDIPWIGQVDVSPVFGGISGFGPQVLIRQLAISPDGSRVFAPVDNSSSLNIIDTASGVTSTIDLTETSDRWAIDVTADGTKVIVVGKSAHHVIIVDALTETVESKVHLASLSTITGRFLSPSYLVPGSALNISADADLTPHGFRDYVTMAGGTLRLLANWTTAKHLSSIQERSSLDTNGFDASLAGRMTGDFSKQGLGTLTLTAVDIGTGSITAAGGVLYVAGTYSGNVRAESGATVTGNGIIGGTLDARAGSIVAPRSSSHPSSLIVGNATLAAGSTLRIAVDAISPGVGYSQLDVYGAATLAGATLDIVLGYTPSPGTQFTILTNRTSGTFAGLAEGAFLTAGGVSFHITYTGGDGDDVVLTVNGVPTMTALDDLEIDEDAGPRVVNLIVGDDLTAAGNLTVSASSSNTSLVANDGFSVSGTDAARTLQFAPVADQSGVTTITVRVTDGGGLYVERSFVVTVVPTPAITYYLAEGATGPFFDTDLLLANPNAVAAPVAITFLLENGTSIVETRDLPATSRTTIHADEVAGLEAANFSTVVVSTDGQPLAVERTMRWGAGGYGAHSEKATSGAAPTWYFAEGAQGFFSTYLLLANPQQTANTATVTWLREGEPALVRSYPLAPASRTTIDASLDAELANRSFGARVSFDQPGVAERAMYFGSDPAWLGGHAAAGATAPATSWFLAEGATGSYFTTFVLLANPGDQAADVTLTYLPEAGDPVTLTVTLAAGQRMTRNIAGEHPSLASAAVATAVSATQPIVVERAQYWGSPVWIESHNSVGVTAGGRRWALAEGRVGGTDEAQTYILLANPGQNDANVTLTFLRTDGTTIEKTVAVPAARRVTIGITGSAESFVPELADEAFGARIDSTQPIVVERSLYSNANGVIWAAGTNATATALPEPH